MSTIKTLGEFMTDCARTTHRLSCYTPLPSHAAQVSASLSISVSREAFHTPSKAT